MFKNIVTHPIHRRDTKILRASKVASPEKRERSPVPPRRGCWYSAQSWRPIMFHWFRGVPYHMSLHKISVAGLRPIAQVTLP